MIMALHGIILKLSYAKTLVRSMIVDIVCGREIERPTDHMASHEGAAYFFCSEACREKFEGNRAHYARPLGEEPVLRHKIA